MDKLQPDEKGFRYILMWIRELQKDKSLPIQSYLLEWEEFIVDAEKRIAELEAQTVKQEQEPDDNSAIDAAWNILKPQLDPPKWTAGESFTYRGFFTWGWEARRQYEAKPSQEPVARYAVMEFAKLMEKELAANDHKGGWRGMAPSELLCRLGEECAELQEAMVSGRNTIMEEAADVANFAMMIADNFGFSAQECKGELQYSLAKLPFTHPPADAQQQEPVAFGMLYTKASDKLLSVKLPTQDVTGHDVPLFAYPPDAAQEIAELNHYNTQLVIASSNMQQEIERLESQLAEYKADAERYQVIKNHAEVTFSDELLFVSGLGTPIYSHCPSKDELDSASDAAIAKVQP